MKLMLIFIFAVMLAIFGAVVFYAGARYKEVSISQACDDKDQEKTSIAGHIYYCDDYDHAKGLINYLMAQANKRGA
jgi:hypothetical protein